MEAKAHKLVVVHDGHKPGSHGIAIAQDLYLDGKRILVPQGSIVKVEIGDLDAMQATITLFADVEFRDPPPATVADAYRALTQAQRNLREAGKALVDAKTEDKRRRRATKRGANGRLQFKRLGKVYPFGQR